jgi:hypothetical protein
VRRIQDLQRPIAQLARLSDQLSATALSDDQRAMAGGIAAQVTTVGGILDDLLRLMRSGKT